MDEYRSRRRGRRKTSHGRYRTIDPGRAGSRSVRGSGAGRLQYVPPRIHEQRGGRGRRRPLSRNAKRVLSVLVLVAIAVVALSVYRLTRPATVTIAATPSDSLILFNGSVAGTGTLEVVDVKGGEYTVYVERTGFEPVSSTVEVRQGRHERLSYDLVPLPQQVAVVTHPEGATVTLWRNGSIAHQGPSPLDVQVPSGVYTLTIELPGYKTFASEMSIDTTTTLEYRLEPEGQVLNGIGPITTDGGRHDEHSAWIVKRDTPRRYRGCGRS